MSESKHRGNGDDTRLLLYIADNEPCSPLGIPKRLKPLVPVLRGRGWIVWTGQGWGLNPEGASGRPALEAALARQVERALERL